MIPNQSLIKDIVSRSIGRYSFISHLHRDKEGSPGQFSDHYYHTTEGPYGNQQHETDLFFTPLAFTDFARSNETVGSPGVLFADLDDAPHPVIKPSVYWETSPGNFQGVWYLDRVIKDYKVWADLNRRLTYYLMADKGGWMGSKLLRVPESVNWKRRAFGALIWAKDHEYEVDMLQNRLPHLATKEVSAKSPGLPNLPSLEDSQRTTVDLWFKIGLRGQSMLVKPNVGDRSLHIVRTIHELRQKGLVDVDIFTLIWWRPWNKWRTSRWDPEQLWTEILNSAT